MLLPNDKQKTRLFQFAGTARFAYNWALDKQMAAFENGEKFINDENNSDQLEELNNNLKMIYGDRFSQIAKL